jgi:hypothetical protein
MATKRDLEDEIKRKDERLEELRKELNDANSLVGKMREQVQDCNDQIERWIDAFNMQQDEDGVWVWSQKPQEIYDEYADLLKDWNRLVPQWNAMIADRPSAKSAGRPLAASEEQTREAQYLHKHGESLRKIAGETGLSFRTVRTIVAKADGNDEASQRQGMLRKREFDRLRAAEYRRRKKLREALPKQITETHKRGEDLIKAAKGLGKNL